MVDLTSADQVRALAAAEIDAEGEILVRELDECPRRTRVARLAAQFDLSVWITDDEWLSPPPVAQWANPDDKRHSR